MTAFGPLFAYPVFLAVNARAPLAQRAALHRMQIAFSQRVTGPVIVVILLAGAYLKSDRDQWDEPWVTISLAMLIVIAGLGVTVLRRSEERLAAAAEAADKDGYIRSLQAARTWTVATIALVVVTIFVMTARLLAVGSCAIPAERGERATELLPARPAV